MGIFSENRRTDWTGFICQRTGLIRQRTGLIRYRIKPVGQRIKPVRQRIKPVHLVLTFFLFSQPLVFCQQRKLYHQNQRRKLLILRSYVDLLNYPFKEYFIHGLQLSFLLCYSSIAFWQVDVLGSGALLCRPAVEDLVLSSSRSPNLLNILGMSLGTWSIGERRYQQIAMSTLQGWYSRSRCAVSLS